MLFIILTTLSYYDLMFISYDITSILFEYYLFYICIIIVYNNLCYNLNCLKIMIVIKVFTKLIQIHFKSKSYNSEYKVSPITANTR